MDVLLNSLAIFFMSTIFFIDSLHGLTCAVQINSSRRVQNNFENCATNITCGFSQNSIKLTWINPENQRNLTHYGFYIREEDNNQINTIEYLQFDGFKDEQIIPFKNVKPFTAYDVQLILAVNSVLSYSTDVVCESSSLTPVIDIEDIDNNTKILIAVCSTIVFLTVTIASGILLFFLRRRSKHLSRIEKLNTTEKTTKETKCSHLSDEHLESQSFLSRDKNQNVNKGYDYCLTNPGNTTNNPELRTDRQETFHGISNAGTKQGEKNTIESNSYDYCTPATQCFVDNTYSTTQRGGESISTTHAQKDSSESYDHVELGEPDSYEHIVRHNTDNNVQCDTYDQVNLKKY